MPFTDEQRDALLESLSQEIGRLNTRLDAAGIPAGIVAFAPFALHASIDADEPKAWDNGTKGWNTAYLAAVPGLYTFDGKQYDVRVSNRTRLALPTGAKLPAKVPANTDLILAPGGQYRTDATCVVEGNATVQTDGWLADRKTPRATITSPAGSGVTFAIKGDDVVIAGLAFDSDYKGPLKQCWDAMRPQAKRFAAVGCLYVNVGYGINAEGQPDGVYDCDNADASATAVKGYGHWIAGRNATIHRLKVRNSTVEHAVRTGGVVNVQIVDCELGNLEEAQTGAAGDTTKGSITIQDARRVYVRGGHVTGPVSVGPLAVEAKPSAAAKAQRSRDVVFDGVRIDARINVRHGSENVTFRNVTGSNGDMAYIQADGFNPTWDRGVKGLTLDGVTAVASLSWKDAKTGQWFARPHPTADVPGAQVNGMLLVNGPGLERLIVINSKFVPIAVRAKTWVIRADGAIKGLTLDNNDYGGAGLAVGDAIVPPAGFVERVGG